jgi:hypothetical protein
MHSVKLVCSRLPFSRRDSTETSPNSDTMQVQNFVYVGGVLVVLATLYRRIHLSQHKQCFIRSILLLVIHTVCGFLHTFEPSEQLKMLYRGNQVLEVSNFFWSVTDFEHRCLLECR